MFKLILLILLLIDNYLIHCSELDRSLDTYFSRFGSRIDQLILRLDHLDSRINRFSSLVQGRLDNVENSLTTTKLRMDLWSEELNRIEEQLTRKWKTLETKFDLIVSAIDSKLETKLTIIQRDNRRHNEHLSNSFLNFGQRVEHSNEKLINEINGEQKKKLNDTCHPTTSNTTMMVNEMKLIYDKIENKSLEIVKSSGTFVSGKVNNMFDDLIKRSEVIQIGIKDTLNLINSSYQLKLKSNSIDNQQQSSTETMSAVIVESLASVESMSTILGRRIMELNRNIDEKFDMISMTMNGFLESCIRIQDGTPLIEEHIAEILEKLLDSFENSTKTTQSTLESLNLCPPPHPQQTQQSTIDDLLNQYIEPNQTIIDIYGSKAAEILRNSTDLSEDEKTLLWESLFPNNSSNYL